MFYVYLFRDHDGVPIYVGKGQKRRAWRHGQRFNGRPRIVQNFALEAEALAFERMLIAQYGRCVDGTGTLENISAGAPSSPVVNERARQLLADPEFKTKALSMLAELPAPASYRQTFEEKAQVELDRWKSTLTRKQLRHLNRKRSRRD